MRTASRRTFSSSSTTSNISRVSFITKKSSPTSRDELTRPPHSSMPRVRQLYIVLTLEPCPMSWPQCDAAHAVVGSHPADPGQSFEKAEHVGRAKEHPNVRAGKGPFSRLELEIEVGPPAIVQVQ